MKKDVDLLIGLDLYYNLKLTTSREICGDKFSREICGDTIFCGNKFKKEKMVTLLFLQST